MHSLIGFSQLQPFGVFQWFSVNQLLLSNIYPKSFNLVKVSVVSEDAFINVVVYSGLESAFGKLLFFLESFHLITDLFNFLSVRFSSLIEDLVLMTLTIFLIETYSLSLGDLLRLFLAFFCILFGRFEFSNLGFEGIFLNFL